MKWLWGRGLVVELDGGDAKGRVMNLEERLSIALLGGRALADYVLASLMDGSVKPLDPTNPLVISPGMLLGSTLSTASKTTVAAVSPLTGLAGRSSAGAMLGWEVRRLGYDFLAITGSLDEPGLLVIDEDGVQVEPARDTWGLRISEARSILRQRYRGYSDAIIGPAGENLSAISMIDFNGRQAGRNGLGAVMGSKRLKAILVKGAGRPEPHDYEAVRRITRALNEATHSDPSSRNLADYGTPLMLQYTGGALGIIPSLNWKKSTLSWCKDPEKALEELSRFAKGRRVKRNTCPFCGRPCSQVIMIDGRETDGPEYETVYALGTNIGICKLDDVARLNLAADELGFDTISLGGTLAWAIEAGEKGLMEGTPGWGDVDGLIRLVEDMAYRRGYIGGLLADGVRRAVETLGKGAEFALHVKGMEPPAYDVRGLKGMALGYAVSTRGADHLTGGAYAVEIPGRLWRFSGVNRLSYDGKAVLVKELEDLMAFYDNTGICKFSRRTLFPDNVAPLVEALTGERMTAGDLLDSGAIAVNLERLLNVALGAGPELDDLPPRIKGEPISDGPSRGEAVNDEMLRVMVKEYYAARGWSSKGIPLEATLLRLGILDMLPDWLRGWAAREP